MTTATATTYPLTKRSMSVWARWRAGSESQRRHEERGLHPDEAAGLRQLACNLLDAGDPLKWFDLTGTGISLSERAERLLLRRLRIEPGAVPDLCRALCSGEGWRARAIENAARKHAGIPLRKEVRIAHENSDRDEPSFSADVKRLVEPTALPSGRALTPAPERLPRNRMATPVSEQRKERDVIGSIAVNGTPAPKWKVSESAFRMAVEAAGKLGISLENLPEYVERKRIVRSTGYTESTVSTALKEYRAGRRVAGTALPPTPEPAPIEFVLEVREEVREEAPATTTEATTHPVTVLRQGEEPQTEERQALVTRLLDQQMGDGGHLPVEGEKAEGGSDPDWLVSVKGWLNSACNDPIPLSGLHLLVTAYTGSRAQVDGLDAQLRELTLEIERLKEQVRQITQDRDVALSTVRMTERDRDTNAQSAAQLAGRVRELTAQAADDAKFLDWQKEVLDALGPAPECSEVNTAGEHVALILRERDEARQELAALRAQPTQDASGEVERLRGIIKTWMSAQLDDETTAIQQRKLKQYRKRSRKLRAEAWDALCKARWSETPPAEAQAA